MTSNRPVTPSSPIEDQIRFLDDFLREGGDEAPPPPDANDAARQALQRIRALLAEAHRHIVAHPDL